MNDSVNLHHFIKNIRNPELLEMSFKLLEIMNEINKLKKYYNYKINIKLFLSSIQK